MNILAIELSTSQGSLALFRDDEVLATREWNEGAFRNQHIFAAVPELLSEVDVAIEGIDCFAVGRGPGNFSGLRISISAANGFALADHKEVYAVSSGEALAQAIASEREAKSVAVVGDARREMLWHCLFESTDVGLRPTDEWQLSSLEESAERLAEAGIVVSPDWERLADRLTGGLGDLPWVQENRFPTALDVGLLVAARKSRGLPSEELAPLYMHPPVFIPPRFPSE